MNEPFATFPFVVPVSVPIRFAFPHPFGLTLALACVALLIPFSDSLYRLVRETRRRQQDFGSDDSDVPCTRLDIQSVHSVLFLLPLQIRQQ